MHHGPVCMYKWVWGVFQCPLQSLVNLAAISVIGFYHVLSTYQFDRSCHHAREVVSHRWQIQILETQVPCAAKKSPQSGALEHRVPVSNVYLYIYTYDIYKLYGIWHMTHYNTLYVSIHYIYIQNGHDYNNTMVISSATSKTPGDLGRHSLGVSPH